MSILLTLLLVVVWVLAWGEVSLANILSGLVVALALLVAFPATRRRAGRVKVHPVALVRLVLSVTWQLLVSTVLVGREILSRRSHVRTGVIAYEVRHPSDLVLTLIANTLALAPGTMAVDVTREPPIVYVHFLLLSDVDQARRTIGRLEDLLVAAVEAGDAAPTGRSTTEDDS